MNVDKMAKKDAYDYGVAQMFFGEGAGTRRKLIQAHVSDKAQNIPGYAEKFEAAVHALSQTEVAEKAIAERKRIDSMAKAGKNLRAIRAGNLAGLDNKVAFTVFFGVGIYTVLRATDYDKVLEAEMKKLWERVKADVRNRKATREARDLRIARMDAADFNEQARS